MESAPASETAQCGPESPENILELKHRLNIMQKLLSRLAKANGDQEDNDDSGMPPGSDAYAPHLMIERVRKMLGLMSDKHLALLCDIPFHRLKKIKERKLPMSPTLLLRLHELTGIEVRQLRSWMGDTTELFHRGQIIAQLDTSLPRKRPGRRPSTKVKPPVSLNS